MIIKSKVIGHHRPLVGFATIVSTLFDLDPYLFRPLSISEMVLLFSSSSHLIVFYAHLFSDLFLRFDVLNL